MSEIATKINEENLVNIQNELLLVGAFYKNPDFYVEYGKLIVSKYDFYDDCCRFYYDIFALMYKTFSQKTDQMTVDNFMSQNDERFSTYMKYSGYKVIKTWMDITDVDNFKEYYNMVKKYSLLREYYRKGFPITTKFINHPRFNTMTAKDIYSVMRGMADKINTVIMGNNDGVIINENIGHTINNYLIEPDIGMSFPWRVPTEMYRGARLGKVLFEGLLSNEGKTRRMMLFAAFTVICQHEKFVLLSNEMDEADLRSCFITTVLNNRCFKEIHHIDLIKPEKEIVLGLYRDDKTNKFITRGKDLNSGVFLESEEEYIKRVAKGSSEYKLVKKLADWVDSMREQSLFFCDVGNDYSDNNLKFIFSKYNTIYNVKYGGYDTMKSYGDENWQSLKITATKLKEMAKEINMFLYSVFQLTDDSVVVPIPELGSLNVANSKQIKHVADILTMGKRIRQDEKYMYQYLPFDCWGEPKPQPLKNDITYYGFKTDKNRGGDKNAIALYSVNLDLNTWDNVGILQQSENYKVDANKKNKRLYYNK